MCHSSLPLAALLSGEFGDVDVSQLKSNEELLNRCCVKTCKVAMARKKLVCNNLETAKHEDYPHHANGEYGFIDWSYDEPDADIKWSCCQPSDDEARPKQVCKDLVGDSKCPVGTRIATKARATSFRNFTAMSGSDVIKYCCVPVSDCYTKLTAKNLDCNDFGLKAGRNTPHVAFWFRMSRRE